MPTERLQWILSLDGDREVKQRMKAVRNEVDSSSRGIVGSIKAMRSMISAAFAFIGTYIIGKTTQIIGQLAGWAEQNRVVQMSSERLAKGIGQDYREILAGMKRGVGGAVDELSLLRQANSAILLGLPVTAANMEELSRVALRLGRAVGRTATEAVEDLTIGLARQSKLILDNLGLLVDTEQANIRWAASHGKVVEAMTEAEKKLAFFEAGMEAARAKAAELGDVGAGLGEKWDRLTATIKDTWAPRIRDFLVPALESVLDIVGRIAGATEPLSVRLAGLGGGLVAQRLQMQQEQLDLEQQKQALRLRRGEAALALGAYRMTPEEARAELSKVGEARLTTLQAQAEKEIEIQRAGAQGAIFTGGLRNELAALEATGKAQDERIARLRELIDVTTELQRIETQLQELRMRPGELPELVAEARRPTTGERLERLIPYRTIEEKPVPREVYPTREVFSAAWSDGGWGWRTATKIGSEEMVKSFEKATRRVRILLEEPPRAMEDAFESALLRMERLLMAFGMRGTSVFRNMATVMSGVAQLSGGRAPSPAMLQISEAVGRMGAVVSTLVATNQLLRGIANLMQPGPNWSMMSTARLEEIVAEEKKGGYVYTATGQRVPAEEARMAVVTGAEQELVRRAGGTATAGSQTFRSVTAITEVQANVMTAVLETIRTQGDRRDTILTRMDGKLGNIEFLTAAHSLSLVPFAGV